MNKFPSANFDGDTIFSNNCGTGAGGFQSGNTCGGGGGGQVGGSVPGRPRSAMASILYKSIDADGKVVAEGDKMSMKRHANANGGSVALGSPRSELGKQMSVVIKKDQVNLANYEKGLMGAPHPDFNVLDVMSIRVALGKPDFSVQRVENHPDGGLVARVHYPSRHNYAGGSPARSGYIAEAKFRVSGNGHKAEWLSR